MSCSSKGSFNGGCCPPAQFFTEELCGNFAPGSQIVWATAETGEYFEGTFQIFNSSSSTGNVVGNVIDVNGNNTVITVPPGFTLSRSVTNPVTFNITAPAGASGTYCINLYKRVRA
ncbi:S-Ena type endospore appendage [Priestia sp. TSO9]|uniref:S-Ena type endospore appendage n=1 Tax=Priestia sp. TSO9 TaxID=2885632 RepID=UPI001E28BFC3|nr:S-Ena type endospore appendage [Priestia sp. TSO9]